ncbi:MAG: InlB B-repeat-containing protein [Oscillospiraceae bacterium]|nr:InlB B-repeat-containing protein [Oscillospiraceae bacterium]
MRKRVSAVIIILCMLFSMIQHSVLAYTDVKITYNGQVVDSFAGVDAIYATLGSYNNVDTNATYSCAAFLKKFCSTLWGVTIYNINTVNAAPSVSKSGHSVYLKTVSSPRPGDIMQTKNYGHVAVVKSVSGSNAILIEQNWSYNSGGYRYARKERSVPISSVYFYRIVIDGVEAEVPGSASSYFVDFDANGGTLDSGYKAGYNTDLVNVARGPDCMVICNQGATTGHNMYGVEAIVDSNYRVTKIIDYVGNSSIPSGGFVISGNGTARQWILDNIEVGDYAFFNSAMNKFFIWTKNQWLTRGLILTNNSTYGELPVPSERQGYLFDGWYTAANGGTKITSSSKFTANSDQTLYAHWTRPEYHVAFNTNGGALSTTPKAETYADGVNVERGVDKLIVFNTGSTTGTNMYGYEVVVNSDHKVIETTYYGGSATIPTGGFVLSGHGTQGVWLDANVEVDEYVTFDEAAKKITIYSPEAWFATNKSVFNGDPYGYLPTPTRDGYEFKGWFADEEYSQEITVETIVTATEDITLYAQWEQINNVTLSTVNGAQIRTTGAQGLRFISSVDKTGVDFSRVMEYGTVLIPSADLTDISELQIGATLNGHTVAKVPANYIYDESDDEVTFTAVITNVAAKNYAREYTARAYAIMDDGSVVYADAGASRSIYAVAKRGLENPNESDTNKEIFQEIVNSVEGGV